MTTQPESRISSAILDALKAAGIFAFKVHGGPRQMAGVPDILACVEGIFVGLEVKVPEKRNNTSARQDYVHGLIRASGGVTEVVCSVPEAMEVVYRIRARIKAAGLTRTYWKKDTV